jgi:NitT/TauT family transport system permease protein
MTGLVHRPFAADTASRDVVVVLAASLPLWQSGVWLFHPSPLILPAPSAIVAAFMETPAVFLRHLGFTLGTTCLVDDAERLCLPWHVSQRERHARSAAHA